MKRFISSDDPVVKNNDYNAILLRLVDELGGNSSEIIEKLGISRDLLENPEAKLSYLQAKKLVDQAIVVADKPDLGLYFGQKLNIMTHGDLGQAALTCNNLFEAAELITKYLTTRFPFFKPKFFVEDDIAIAQIKVPLPFKKFRIFAVDGAFSAFHCMRQYLLGPQAGPVKALFKYATPKDTTHYQQLFGENIHFSQHANHYCFAASELDIPFILADQTTSQLATEKCETQLQKVQVQDDLIMRVHNLLSERTTDFPNLDSIAEKLFMSPRNLRRHLQKLDTSFQQILDEVRHEQAMEYLQKTHLSIEEISHKLGFSDPSNFGNAFKRWTGKAPSYYRTSSQTLDHSNSDTTV